MNDSGEKRLDEIFALARGAKPDAESIEYGFETRLMARIAEEQADLANAFVWVWRFVPVFSMIVLLLGLYRIFLAPPGLTDLRTAVLSGYEEPIPTDFMTGE